MRIIATFYRVKRPAVLLTPSQLCKAGSVNQQDHCHRHWTLQGFVTNALPPCESWMALTTSTDTERDHQRPRICEIAAFRYLYISPSS